MLHSRLDANNGSASAVQRAAVEGVRLNGTVDVLIDSDAADVVRTSDEAANRWRVTELCF